jgi:hypothetical protein
MGLTLHLVSPKHQFSLLHQAGLIVTRLVTSLTELAFLQASSMSTFVFRVALI